MDDLHDTMIHCHSFGMGLTINDEGACIFLTMGEHTDEATHFIAIERDHVNAFVNGVIAMAQEVAMVNAELDDLAGEAKEHRIKDIQSRYSAGQN